MTFQDLIAPIPIDQFLANYYGQRPLHIPAGARSASARHVLDWPRFNDLLQIASHWIEPNMRLILNSQPIAPDFYLDEVATQAGRIRRASAAKIELFMAMGASLVANGVEDISPPIQQVGAMLSDQFAGLMGANLYCSFQGVQAFNSHFDLSEIFVLHCEGEKTWRLYENRAHHPLFPPTGPQAQAGMDRAKGRIMAEVTLRPGDLLYLPRGWYHDALASSEAALHVTYAITPYSGRILFKLLEEVALDDPDFRAYLPDARQEGEKADAMLCALATKIGAILTNPAFRRGLATAQAKLVSRPHPLHLPERPALHWYQATGQNARMERVSSGWQLHVSGQAIPVSVGVDTINWSLQRPAFSREEAAARIPHEAGQLDEALALLLRAQIITPMAAAPSL